MGKQRETFTRDEYYVLAMVNTNSRQEAIRLLEEDIGNEMDLNAVQLKTSVLRKLKSISDFEFLLLDIDSYAEDLRDMVMDDMLTDMGVMSEDGTVLRELTEDERIRINARLDEIKIFL